MNYTIAEEEAYLKAMQTEKDRLNKIASIYKESRDTILDKLAVYRDMKLRGEYVSSYEEFRLNELIAQINSIIDQMYYRLTDEIKAGFSDIYQTGYYYQTFGIEASLNTEAGLGASYILNNPVLSQGAIEAAMSEKIGGYTFLDRMGMDKTFMQYQLREAVTSVLIEGQTTTELKKRLAKIDDIFIANKSKTDRTARTELLRAYSYGNDTARREAESAGVKFKYKWSSALDSRTRPDHVRMDGVYAKIKDGEPIFSLPDGSKAAGPRMIAVDSRGVQIGHLDASQVVNCRCRRLDLPYGIEPTSRVAKLPSGEWTTVNGDVTASEWIQKNYAIQ